jgi:drug/metabolite transporter (DMT)-like permease
MGKLSRVSLPGLFAGLAAASIWGAMYVVSKAVLDTIPPFTLLTLRLVLGFCALGAFVAGRGLARLSAHQFWRVFGVGFVGYGVSLGFQFVGTKLSTAANGSLVTSITPAFVFLFANWLLGEKVGPREWVALLISTLGVLAVIDPRSAEVQPHLFWGNLSLLAAALTWALYSVLVRKTAREMDVLMLSWIALLGGLPLTIPLAGWELAALGMGTWTPGLVAGVLFLGLVSTALAMYLWNLAFKLLDAGLASLTFFAQPVVGSILGSIFLGEAITPLFLLGGLLIGVGLLLASRRG